MTPTFQTPATGPNTTEPPPNSPIKRSANDDEIEFISSHPVKKTRPNTPDKQPPPTDISHQRIIDQCQVMKQETGQVLPGIPPAAPSAATPENRGASFPVFGNFAFPQSFPPKSWQPRFSVAISPKQVPQILLPSTRSSTSSPAPPQPVPSQPTLPQRAPPQPCPTNTAVSDNATNDGNTNEPAQTNSVMRPPPSTPHPPPHMTPSLDRVPCQDFNGIPTSTPGLDMGLVLSNLDKSFMAGMSVASNPSSNSMSPPPLPAPHFPQLGPQGVIPYAMYSTGSIIPIQQTLHSDAINQRLPHFASYQLQSDSHQPTLTNSIICGPSSRPNDNSARQQQLLQLSQVPQPSTQTASPSPSFPGPNNNKPPCLHCLWEEQLRRAQALPPPNNNSNICKPTQPGSSQTSYTQALNSNFSQPTTFSNSAPPQQQPSAPSQLDISHTQEHLLTPPQPSPTPAQQSLLSSQPALTATNPPFAIPKRSKPSPNLLIDIAETTEEIFPYDDLAARHKTTPHKVFEALSAVILVPLLRCPTDKRRAGKLAQDRVKSYQLTKADLQKSRSDRVDSADIAARLEQAGKQTIDRAD
ncbi:hypothetical protein QBC43DRAFT_355289 [Cladorrhinum sp. PSN259]|nr:hypothetical protein QBC43DRAFT_355289 [Cladorrhinum sp. PSN259]